MATFPSVPFAVSPPLRLNVPAPPCAALSDMARAPVWRTVFTVPNLDSFTNYVAHYATEDERQELLQLPVVYHRGNWDHISTFIPIGVVIEGRWIALPEASCQLVDCPRCTVGRMGYAFYWVDERWTPEVALDLTQNLEEVLGEASQPWPRGILRPPQPSREPGPFLTSDWHRPTDPHSR